MELWLIAWRRITGLAAGCWHGCHDLAKKKTNSSKFHRRRKCKVFDLTAASFGCPDAIRP